MLYSVADATGARGGAVWTYVAYGDLRGYTVSRGRSTERDVFDAGTCTITLNNRARSYDPNTNANFRPMNLWWIRAKYQGSTYDRFFGYADSYHLTWPEKGRDSVTVVSCSDELKVLNLVRLPFFSPADVADYPGVVGRDNPAQYWRWTDELLSTTTVVDEGDSGA